jgi:hypothetical protein
LKIEDSILKSLSEITDINDMLKDETMIDQLANSKKFAMEINQRVAESKITEKEIDIARESKILHFKKIYLDIKLIIKVSDLSHSVLVFCSFVFWIYQTSILCINTHFNGT